MADENANVVISADTSQYSASVAQASTQTNQFAASVDALSAKLDGLTKRAGKKLALFGAADLAAMAAFTKMAANQEQQLESLDAALVGTTRNIGNYTKSINQMARDMPIATGEIIQLVTQLNKMGVQSAQSADSMGRTFLKLSAATSENVYGLTQGMVQLNKQMGTLASGSGAVKGFSNSLLAVSKASGSSAQGILDFSQSIAPFARTAGIGEKALLGVSAAFSAAGQDGFYAANTFNSMIADITRSIKNGSPDIAKYSNLLGVTVQQFKGMDPTDRIVSIFEAINKQGPNAIRTLDLLGQDGIRAAKAIQGVTQSGDLRGMVNKSINSYGNSGTLDKSAEAAWGGMNSQLELMKNNMSQIGQAIGSSLVGPATTALGVFNAMLATVNQVAAPILAMGGVLASIVGGGALGGGAVGAALGTFGKIAMAGYALRSRPVRGLLGGFQSGLQSRTAGGSTGLASKMDDAYTSSAMPRYQERLYMMGRGFGGALADPSSGGTNYLGRALSAPLRLVAWGAQGTGQFYDDSRMNGEDRPRAFSQRAAQRISVFGASREQTRVLRGYDASLQRQVAAGVLTGKEAEEVMKTHRKYAMETLKTASTVTQLGVASKAAAGEMLTAAGKNVRAGLSNVGSVAGTAAGGLARLIGPEMIAIMGGMALWQFNQSANDQRSAPVTDAAKNPISEYNAKLGIATDRLQSFSDALQTNKEKYTSVDSALGDLEGAARRAAESGAVLGTVVKDLNPNDPESGLAFLRGISGQLNPENTPEVMADIYRKYGSKDAANILSEFRGNKTPYGINSSDFTSVISSAEAQNSGPSTWWPGRTTDAANNVAGSVSGAINTSASKVAATGNMFGAYQVASSLSTSAIANALAMYSQKKVGSDVTVKTIQGIENDVIKSDLGLDINTVRTGAAAMKMKPGELPDENTLKNLSGEDFAAYLKSVGTDKSYGKKGNPLKKFYDWYQAQLQQGYDPSMAVAGAYSTSRPSSDPVQMAINATQLGGMAKRSGGIQYALGEGYGGAAATNSAVNELLKGGLDVGGGNSQKTILAFNDLVSAVNLSTDRLSQLGQAAWDAYKALSNLQRGGMSQSAGVARSLANTTALINAPTNNANANAQQDARQTRAQELAGVEEYYKQYAQALYQFNKQKTRSNEDYERSASRATESFGRQMEYSEQDFYRQRLWNQKDFNKSMARAAEDAAKSVYNPWERVYSQLTAGAGNVAQNMEDQNKLIQDQVKNLKKAHSMGLSQQVIDQLDLANPQNAQQFQAILDDAANDPGVIERLNKAARARAKAAKALTQNDDNVSYRRAIADFKTANDRSSALFETSQARARKQFGISMQQMAEDHDRSMKRAQEDMNDYGKVIADNFQDAQSYIKKMTHDLDVSNQYVTNMAKVFADNPDFARWINDGTYGSTDGGSNSGGTGSRGPRNKTWDEKTGRTSNGIAAPTNGPVTTTTSSSRVTDSNNTNSNNRTYVYETNYVMKDPVITSNDPDKLARDLQQMARKNALTKARHIKP